MIIQASRSAFCSSLDEIMILIIAHGDDSLPK